MRVADIIIKAFEMQGITTIFGYPGGANLPLYDALRLNTNVKHVLVRNEQAAAHAANGYARANKKIGACMATSGPGATNLITGIATAYMDSIPMIIVTGQVKSDLIGKDVFQEADIVGATESFTKHNYLVKNPNDIPRVLAEAFYIATTGRPGPVLIDVPRDVLDARIPFSTLPEVSIQGYNPTIEGHAGQIKRALQKLNAAKRPIIFAGGGVIAAKATEELRAFANAGRIPVINTLMGLGSFPMDSPLFIGMIGYHGHDFALEMISKADFVMIAGSRMSDRATLNFKSLSPQADVVHIDIDPAEIGKIFNHQIPMVGDLKMILRKFNEKITPLDTEGWLEEIAQLRPKLAPVELEATNTVTPKIALRVLSEKVGNDAILVADVGQNQIIAARNFPYNGDRMYLTSGGLGTMGYSLPAGIGATYGAPDKQVITVVGDGGIQMLIAELGTLRQSNNNLIVLLFNNHRLGMVRELQDTQFNSNYYAVEWEFTPDFVKIAEAYGLPAVRVNSNADLPGVFDAALASGGPYFIECMVDPEENCLT
ncbi:biosynthetic-type acetolactate synthase large subunit [Acidaminobacter hydrogenoformans]|uniref:Acetolactate synthase n=1 Tax=Acidaminobacter hydrogenoformans DSM 2784 TaxID=1120920 RepID=A0A1G5RVZ3_9FIRM|nr:biosynthetic-type acetolactate synthase large subunit [Acidaminobacter hydrogenoformans]SCZ78223.1 acetolactate synthase, large subunit [Acidaminobacter hydrogenoformans DSM 2784]